MGRKKSRHSNLSKSKCRMQRLMHVLMTFTLFANSFCSLKFVANNYFPLQIGNVWHLKREPLYPGYNYIDIRSKAIIDTILFNSKRYYVLRDSSGQVYDTYIRFDSLGNVWKYEVLWLNFSLIDTNKYTYLDYEVTVTKNLTIETYAGKFDSCISFLFDNPNWFDDQFSYTFAPGIGLVEESPGAWFDYKLIDANVNGRVISDVKDSKESKEKPNNFELYSNFPNPFNSITTIHFSLNRKDRTKVKIFNLNGQSIGVYFDQVLDLGNHKITLDFNTLSSGIYIYFVKTSGDCKKGRFVLLK